MGNDIEPATAIASLDVGRGGSSNDDDDADDDDSGGGGIGNSELELPPLAVVIVGVGVRRECAAVAAEPML